MENYIREKLEKCLVKAQSEDKLNCHVAQIETMLKKEKFEDIDLMWADYFLGKPHLCHQTSNDIMDEFVNKMYKMGYTLEDDASRGTGKPYTLYWAKGEIKLWTSCEIITNVWFSGGSVAVGKWNGKFANESVLRDIDNSLGKDLCTTCGIERTEDNKGGSHFAGKYCKKCWEEYKEGNPGTCGKCKKHRFVCYC